MIAWVSYKTFTVLYIHYVYTYMHHYVNTYIY